MLTRQYNKHGHYSLEETPPTKAAQAVQAASDAYALREFIGHEQLRMLRELVRETTEEHEHFRQILRTYITRIEAMPVEYKSDEGNPIAYLHYFKGNCDWYIIEKDSDPDKEGQIQCMGFANLGDPQNAELGYINVKELLACHVELDLYWEPKPLQPIVDAMKNREERLTYLTISQRRRTTTMSKEQKKIINQLLLERIEKSDDEYDAGNKMLTVSIDYKKDGWRPNPRGYYLSLHVNLHTDNHLIITAMSFGDKGDPYAYVLIEPAKMFSAKKLNQLTITPQQMDLYVNSMIDTYRRRRATQLERRETNKQRNAEALLARQREKEEVHS